MSTTEPVTTEPVTTTTTVDNSVVKAELVAAVLEQLGVADDTVTTTTTQPQPQTQTGVVPGSIQERAAAGTMSVNELEKFLGPRCTWCYTGGYAMFKWLDHYGLDVVETNDLDILIYHDKRNEVFAELFGGGGDREWFAEGKKVSLLSSSGEPDIKQLGDAFVVTPDKLAANYGFGKTETSTGSLLGDIARGGFKLRKVGGPKGEPEQEPEVGQANSDEPVEVDDDKVAKEARRDRRRALMTPLTEAYRKEFGGD